jgi:hypothetical protein
MLRVADAAMQATACSLLKLKELCFLFSDKRVSWLIIFPMAADERKFFLIESL